MESWFQGRCCRLFAPPCWFGLRQGRVPDPEWISSVRAALRPRCCCARLSVFCAEGFLNKASGWRGVRLCAQVLLCRLVDILDGAVPWDAGPAFDLEAGEEARYIPRDFRCGICGFCRFCFAFSVRFLAVASDAPARFTACPTRLQVPASSMHSCLKRPIATHPTG